MTTPSHILYNLALLGSRSGSRARLAGVGIGSVLPDASVMAFFIFFSVFVGDFRMAVWDDWYFNSAWRAAFNLSHSLWLWPLVCATGFFCKREFVTWLGASALMHTLCDMAVHATDAYEHLYPFSAWRFESPISYWNPEFHGNSVRLAEIALACAAAYALFRRFPARPARAATIGLAATTIATGAAYYGLFGSM